jgi:hypothetical protein
MQDSLQYSISCPHCSYYIRHSFPHLHFLSVRRSRKKVPMRYRHIALSPSTCSSHTSNYQQPLTDLESNFSKPVAHALTALCAPTGVILIVLFLYYHKRYSHIRLGAEPSGIATIAALLSESTFPATTGLRPGDSIEIIQEKLSKFRFRLRSNGAIEATPSPEGQI